jgi:hypothetical protein
MPNPSGDAKNMSATAQHLFAMEITVGTGSKRYAVLELSAVVMTLIGL